MTCMSSPFTPAFVELAVDSSAIPGPGVVPVLAPPARIRLGATQWILLKAVEAFPVPGVIL